jgi:hypothetical protein
MGTKREIRFFNTTGPCNPDDHYMLPPEERLIGAQLHRYIRDKLYWVLHAPRQTGKTTFLLNWMREINAGDEAVACYVSVEQSQAFPDAARAIPGICSAIIEYAKAFGLPVPSIPETSGEFMLGGILSDWAKKVSPKPLIVLFDETDVLQDEALITFLRVLRGGFASRGTGIFPVSIALVGMRDLKDYITASKGGVAPNPGSPFNIKEDSVILGNFTKNDIVHLFAQRTAETGQQIAPEALDYVWAQSQGQPWIVNNLFKRATMRVLDYESRETVTAEHVSEAREQMITARETHLDALGKRLGDPRVKRVVQTVITGDMEPPLGRTDSDVELSLDMGLVRWDTRKGFVISNPIYEEILIRYLNSAYHDSTPPPSSWEWQNPDGSLDMDSLLREFQGFWREHSEIWEERADYTEAFPHLLLMAFLQRITNGGGNVERETAAGRGRLDLAVEYEKKWYILEIKIIHSYSSPKAVMEKGLGQIRFYRDRTHPEAPAYLVIFDRRPGTKEKPWEERLGWEEVGGVRVVRC